MGTPICDPTTMFCRGCYSDAECGASEVCTESDGTCHNASNALFIAPTGSGATCSRSSPCTFTTALNQTANNQRIIVVLDGNYTAQFNVSSFSSNSLTISGEDRDPAGATVSSSITAGISIAASNKPVVIEGLTVGPTAAQGILNNGVLTLSHMHVRNATMSGVASPGQGLTVLDSVVSSNNTRGIDTNAGPLVIERTQIYDNPLGGLDITNVSFSVENTIIARNGSSTSNFGGVRIQNVGGQSPQVFQFNTVTLNMATADAGMQCPASLVVDSSIVTEAIMTGGCTAVFSIIGTATDPVFVSATDYHLQPGSPGVDMANPDATITTDIDEQNRAGARDIGADEVIP